MKEGIDETSCKHQKPRQILLHGIVEIIIVIRSNLKVLFQLHRWSPNNGHDRDTGRNHLEKIFLVAEGLLFLIPQLCQRVVEAVVVHQLEIATSLSVGA